MASQEILDTLLAVKQIVLCVTADKFCGHRMQVF